ncbi:hypothetical protein BCR43DRAFT_564140 [Syncephalastrum racemosum]|uniref:Zn(2)-C6 fungal-type domain-containing protein n=1 Tax=Syncephalastrum racemosum TaxID=13706 RepID=A0A1X2HDR6_SYNRA|nr:hypothetical protein BCR43DRAFT_564140 [Syncephalastrum racemosum]
MTSPPKSKALKYHFIDMNSPTRFKKLKVAHACNFCRKRKAKCDVGTPGSHSCSNCLKANTLCVFTSNSSASATASSAAAISVSRTIPPTVAQDMIPAGGYNKHYHHHNKHHSTLQSVANRIYTSPSVSPHEQDRDSYFSPGLSPALTPVLLRPSYYNHQHQDRLLVIYEVHIQPFYPVLFEHTPRSLCQHAQQQQDLGSSTVALRFAVFAVAASYTSMSAEAKDYYDQAMQLLNDPQVDNLRTAQLHLLLHKCHVILEEQRGDDDSGPTFRMAPDFHLSSAWTVLSQHLRHNNAHDDEWARAYAICYANLCLGKLATAYHTPWTFNIQQTFSGSLPRILNNADALPRHSSLKSLFWLVKLANLIDTYMHAYYTTIMVARQDVSTYLHQLQELECELHTLPMPHSIYFQAVLCSARLFVHLFHVKTLDYVQICLDMTRVDGAMTHLNQQVLRAAIQGGSMASFMLQLLQHLGEHMESFPTPRYSLTIGEHHGIHCLTTRSHWERPPSPSITLVDQGLYSPSKEDDPDYFYDLQMLMSVQDNSIYNVAQTSVSDVQDISLDPHVMTPTSCYTEEGFHLDYPARMV